MYLIVFFSAVFLLCNANPNKITQRLNDPSIKKELSILRKLISLKSATSTSFECYVCGMALNEIEGFLIQNLTVLEIQKLLEKDVCSHFDNGTVPKMLCDFLVTKVDWIIDQITNTNSVSILCVDMHMCQAPFNVPADMVPVPRFTLNLDLPPQNRWTKICSYPTVASNGQFLYDFVKKLLPGHGVRLNELGMLINDDYFPTEYGGEVRGCAAAMGIPYGWLALFQLGYEATDDCTSIISERPDGTVYLSRNLDFAMGMGFTNTLRIPRFRLIFKNQEKLFLQLQLLEDILAL